VKYKIAIAIFIILMLTSGWSCLQSTGSAPRAELAVLKKELVTDNQTGSVAVLVTVKNTSNVIAELAEVKVSFYDSQKELIDSERDSILNLKPNETWDFTLTCQSERCGQIKSYNVETTAGSSSGGL
jgi:hypothetical protein